MEKTKLIMRIISMKTVIILIVTAIPKPLIRILQMKKRNLQDYIGI